MNTRRLTPAVMIAATLAALFVAQGASAVAAAPAPGVGLGVLVECARVKADGCALLPNKCLPRPSTTG